MIDKQDNSAQRATSNAAWTPRASTAALIGPHQEDDPWMLPGSRMDTSYWFGCRVSPRLFEAIWLSRLQGLEFSLGRFTDSAGADYGYAVNQHSVYQHRLLLPLYEPRVRRYVERLGGQTFGFIMLNDEDPNEVHAFSAPCSGREVQWLLNHSKELAGQSLLEARRGMRRTLVQGLQPAALPSLTDRSVQEVCVSFAVHQAVDAP